MSINMNKNSNPTILTSYSFNNNPTMQSSYQSSTQYKNSYMGTPQFQPPSSFYSNPSSHQTVIQNVTSSFGLNNHIESIPMASSIYRNEIVQQELQAENLLLNQPITPITNVYYNSNNNINNNNNSIICSKLSSAQSSLQNTKNRQQIANVNFIHNMEGNFSINSINNMNKNSNRYWDKQSEQRQKQPLQKIHQQIQQIQDININSRNKNDPFPSNGNRNNTPLIKKMKERQQLQKYQKQYKQVQKRLSNNISILSNRSKSKNKSQASQISKQSRRQSSNSNNTYNYNHRSRSQNKNQSQNCQKVKVLSKIVQKLKNQQKNQNTQNIQYPHLQSQDRSEKRSPNSHSNSNTNRNIFPRKQQNQHRQNTIPLSSNNLQSKKIQDLLKDIKQLNKQNSKAIYTIKRTTAKDNTPKQYKTQQQLQDSFSATSPQIPPSNLIQQNVYYNKDGGCPTCGCICKMKRKTNVEASSTKNMINEQVINANKIRYI